MRTPFATHFKLAALAFVGNLFGGAATRQRRMTPLKALLVGVALTGAGLVATNGAPALAASPPTPPTNLHVTAATLTTMTIAWSPGYRTNADGIQVNCRDLTAQTSCTPYIIPPYSAAINAGSAQLIGLQPGDTYDIFLCDASFVGSYTSICSSHVQAAAMPLTAPGNLHLVGSTATTATIAFTPGAGGDWVTIRCMDVTANVACTPYDVSGGTTTTGLSGLQSGHSYQVRVCEESSEAGEACSPAPLTVQPVAPTVIIVSGPIVRENGPFSNPCLLVLSPDPCPLP